MRCASVLLAVLLTACGQQPAENLADALAADPVLGCARNARPTGAVGEDACRAAAEAFRRRFFAGHTGPDEYNSLAELPPIPASFDEPTGRTRHERRDHHRPFLDTFSRYIDSGFGLLHGEVAFLTATLIVIDMTIAGLYWAMSHATGQGEDVIKLLRKVLYVGAFAYIIGNFNWLAGIVFRSFAGLGLMAGGSLSMEHFLQPGRLAKTGLDAAGPIFLQLDDMMGFPEVFANLDAILVLFLAWLVVILCFFVLAVQLFITLIEFADHACRLRAGAVRALEQDELPGGKSARQRGVVGHQGLGTGRHRRHRLGPVLAVPGSSR